MPKKLIATLGGVAVVLFLVSIALGSSGEIEGEAGTGQQIANVTFPIAVLLAFAVIVILAVSAVRLALRRESN